MGKWSSHVWLASVVLLIGACGRLAHYFSGKLVVSNIPAYRHCEVVTPPKIATPGQFSRLCLS